MNFEQQQGPPIPPMNSAKHAFTPDQLQQLRAQIVAYRMLARNLPLNPEITMALQGKKMDTPIAIQGPTLNGAPPGPFGPQARPATDIGKLLLQYGDIPCEKSNNFIT